jgi:hypothetical protein
VKEYEQTATLALVLVFDFDFGAARHRVCLTLSGFEPTADVTLDVRS